MAGTPGFGPPEPVEQKGTPGFGPPEPAGAPNKPPEAAPAAAPISIGQTAVEHFGQGGSFGFGDELGARLQQGLAYLKADPNMPPAEVYRQALGENRGILSRSANENPGTAITSELAGALAPSLVPGAALARGGQALTGAGRVALMTGMGAAGGAGAATEGQRLGGAGIGAAIGGALGGGGEALGAGARALAQRFPAIADRLAMRLTGQLPGDVAERVAQNFKNPAGAGKYAEDAANLIKLTPQGTGEAAGAAMRGSGEALGALRAGKSVPVEDVRNLVQTIGSGSGVQVPPEAARELQMLVSKLPQSGSVTLDELATLTQQHANAPMQALRSIGSQASPEASRVLQAAKGGLEQLQTREIGEAAQPAYQQAQKGYAIAKDTVEGISHGMSHPTTTAGKAVFGGAGRAAAYGALKAYQVARSPVVGAMARVAAKAGPAAASTLAQASDSGDPVQMGAALMQAQANDSGAREPEDEAEKAARENLLRDED